MNIKWVQTSLRFLPLPLTLGGVMAASVGALSAGANPATLPVAAMAVSLVLSVLLERVLPRRGHVAEPGENSADLRWFAATAFLSNPLLDAGVLALAVWLLAGSPAGLLSGLPLWLGVLLATLVSSFGDYWAHRWGHERWWKLHAVHHAPHRMVTLNNLRLHPVDLGLKRLMNVLPLLLLGFSPEAVALFGVLNGVNSAFQHSDADLRHGWLNRVLNTNSLHRWHHSNQPQEANTNYGAPLVVWDQLFGTFFLPSESEEPVEMGLFDEQDYPLHSVLRSLVAPLCWGRCVEGHRG